MNAKSINNSESNTPLRFQRFLLSFQFKKIGLFLSISSLVALFINAFVIDSPEIKYFSKDALIAGMLLIAISKEKLEDELISNLRMQSFTLAFIVGVLFSILQPYLNYSFDLISDSDNAIFKDNGDFLILWILLSVKVFYFESLKRFHQ